MKANIARRLCNMRDCIHKMQGPSLKGDGGNGRGYSSPQLLDGEHALSFVPPIFCDKK